jgi:hypothetical protein
MTIAEELVDQAQCVSLAVGESTGHRQDVGAPAQVKVEATTVLVAEHDRESRDRWRLAVRPQAVRDARAVARDPDRSIGRRPAGGGPCSEGPVPAGRRADHRFDCASGPYLTDLSP